VATPCGYSSQGYDSNRLKDSSARYRAVAVSDAVGLHQRNALESVFRDGIGNAIVETAVESSKFIDLHGHTPLKRQIRCRLAQIAIVVDHLVRVNPCPDNSQPCSPQLRPISQTAAPPPEGPETLRLPKVVSRPDVLIEEFALCECAPEFLYQLVGNIQVLVSTS
jgi:hypothetical protein